MTSDKWVFYYGHDEFSVQDICGYFHNEPFAMTMEDNRVIAQHPETSFTITLHGGPWVQAKVRELAAAYSTDEGQRRELERCDRSMYIFYNPYPTSDEFIEVITNIEIDLASRVNGYLFDPHYDTFV